MLTDQVDLIIIIDIVKFSLLIHGQTISETAVQLIGIVLAIAYFILIVFMTILSLLFLEEQSKFICHVHLHFPLKSCLCDYLIVFLAGTLIALARST